ncbi:MAG: DUF1883 domain-containing protein [Flammeovirgaceae bacterium]
MKYLVWDLKQLRRGERVQVTLSANAANVRLMDSSNYNNYLNQNLLVLIYLKSPYLILL